MASAPSFSSFPDLPSASSAAAKDRKERGSGESRKYRDEHGEQGRRDRGEHRNKRRREEDEELRRREDKESRRRDERRRAEALVKDEHRSSGYNRPTTESSSRAARGETTRNRVEEGVPWYESFGKGKATAELVDEIPSSQDFFPDPVGDRDALRYGSTSSLQPPRYYRDGQGRVLGCNEGLRIVLARQRTEKGLELAPRGRPYIPRYSARTLEGSSRNSRRLLLRPNLSESFDPNAPFVSFGARARKQRHEDDTPDYRAISREDEDEDEDTAALAETLGGFASLDQDVQRRTAELDRHLREHPEDVKAWIAYSQLHLKLNPNARTQPGTDPASLPQTRAAAEVTLSVLAKALNHPPNFISIPLHLAYIRAAEAFWPPEKVTKRWQNVLRELGERAHTDKDLESRLMEVWTGYIEWREGQGFGKQEDGAKGAGGVDEVLEVYTECLARLTAMTTDGDTTVKEENQLYLFTRACLFMRQAGYIERAFACFQALMELTLFKPDRLRPPARPSPTWFSGLLTEFETFWDSEAARIGEEGASGWRSSTSAPVSAPALMSAETHSDDPFERWREVETHSESQHFLPARATDLDADGEDPYRVVIFADIQPFLFPIRSGQVRLELVYAFLNFIGLPFRPPDTPTTSPACLDPHLNWSLVYNDQLRASFWPARPRQKQLPWQTVGGEPMEPETQRSLANPFVSPVKSWLSTPDTLFAPSDRWFRDTAATDLAHVDHTLARNVFRLLQPLVPDPTFTAMYLAFESALSPKAAVKLAKAILSEDRDNAAIWDGYARLEVQRGNLGAARSVYGTVLQSDKITDGERQSLYAAWARMEWDSGEEGRSLVVVTAAALGQAIPIDTVEQPSTIALLKAKQHFSAVEYPCSVSMLVLASLHAYLTSGIEAAQGILTRQLSAVRQSGPEAEEVFQLLSRMMYVHTSRHPSPVALPRDNLELAIASFPNNTQFLSLYMWGELGGRVFGRLQRLISHQLQGENGGINGHLWSIWAEAMAAHRTFWDSGGGGAERVRNSLDKSINSKIGKHSAPIWMLYIEFETHMGRYSSAKQLCYRAIAALGGCKPLYLLPFSSSLRPHFPPQELRDWADLMLERGLRLRVPFDEYFDVNEMEAAIVLPEDEELMDDELAFLRDTEEAKPY